MEERKKPNLPNISAKSALRFFEELKQEIKRVSWTAKEELRFSTVVVLVATFLCGLGVYVVDLVIRGVLQAVSTIFSWI